MVRVKKCQNKNMSEIDTVVLRRKLLKSFQNSKSMGTAVGNSFHLLEYGSVKIKR